MKKVIIIFLTLILSACNSKSPSELDLTHREFHYDRMYPNNYRIIAAFRFAEPAGFSADSRKIVQELLFEGLDYNGHTDVEMSYHGKFFNNLNKYKFNFGTDLFDEPEYEKLSAERRPRGARENLFEYQIYFDSYDVVSASNKFIIYRRDWQSIPSDAAHGLYGVFYMTIDLVNKKILEIENVLKPQALEKLDGKIRELLHKQDINPDELYPELLPQPDAYVFEKSGMRLIWNPYSIASYSEGIVFIELPYRQVNKFLNKDGKRLKKNL